MNSIKVFPLNDIAAMRLEIERLSDLVVELSHKLHLSSSTSGPNNILNKGILVYENKVKRHIKFEEIIMIKAESNYSIIYYKNGNSIFTSKTLKYWEERSDVDFLKRIHKSFIINCRLIKSFELRTRTILLEDGHTALYSRAYKNIITDIYEH